MPNLTKHLATEGCVHFQLLLVYGMVRFYDKTPFIVNDGLQESELKSYDTHETTGPHGEHFSVNRRR